MPAYATRLLTIMKTRSLLNWLGLCSKLSSPFPTMALNIIAKNISIKVFSQSCFHQLVRTSLLHSRDLHRCTLERVRKDHFIQWLSTYSMYWNHLEGLVKNRSIWRGLRISILTSILLMLKLLVLGPHFENWFIPPH